MVIISRSEQNSATLTVDLFCLPNLFCLLNTIQNYKIAINYTFMLLKHFLGVLLTENRQHTFLFPCRFFSTCGISVSDESFFKLCMYICSEGSHRWMSSEMSSVLVCLCEGNIYHLLLLGSRKRCNSVCNYEQTDFCHYGDCHYHLAQTN